MISDFGAEGPKFGSNFNLGGPNLRLSGTGSRKEVLELQVLFEEVGDPLWCYAFGSTRRAGRVFLGPSRYNWTRYHSPMVLRTSYEMSVTDVLYAATIPGANLQYAATMPGNNLEYAATSNAAGPGLLSRRSRATVSTAVRLSANAYPHAANSTAKRRRVAAYRPQY
eukprot:2404874-Rhodomonas_salina.3